MDDDPQNRNHVPIHEKARLYRDVDAILNADNFVQTEQMDEDDNGNPVLGVYVDLYASKEGPMDKSGFSRSIVARSEAHVKNGSDVPERTVVVSYGELGNPDEVHQFVFSVDDGYPDFAVRKDQAEFIPDSLEKPAPVSQKEALNARQILTAIKAEMGIEQVG